ncbi:MAG: tRNA (cytidine(34)-2'-O)-methyltransferase [Steroidobacteraceae bacterium]|jgi:tRNA (cytidine/uridine-2'-O-)-methyltransferase|nr:tRNA (cytidine(34)-2'-O)-methyltransferase [Steroidobacteraceae bacterium]
MFHVILHQPEIPPNTGNVIRMCANTGCTLHLVHPLGFTVDDAQVRRAGLDYHEMARVRQHPDLQAALAAVGGRVFAIETAGGRLYTEERFEAGDAFLFGRETVGLPPEVLARFAPERVLRLPMRPGNRSVNLSNSVAVVAFEAWRQLGFPGSC